MIEGLLGSAAQVAASSESLAGAEQPGRVIVVGAGPGGLTAAYLLAKQGVPVTVLESDDEVGGISRTVRYRGYRFDIGGHRFFTKYEPVQALWEEILGSELLKVPRLSRIYYDGKFFDYPLKALNALRRLGPRETAHIVASYVRSRIAPTPGESSFEEWVTNRFGRRLYETFFKTYTEKVWGIPCRDISAEWAAQRIQNLSLGRAILSAASLTRRSAVVRSLIDEFQYPRLGPGQMWEMTRDRVVEMGGEVLMGHRVHTVNTECGGVASVTASTAAGDREFRGSHFISTMPLRSLVRSLRPEPPDAVLQAADGLNYRDFLVVALIVKKEKLFPDNWIYVHSPQAKVGRIQNFNNWSAAMVPEPGRTCLGFEYFCFEGDQLWQAPDEELVALARHELGELGLVDPELVEDGTVVRMAKAYPVYDSDYKVRVATVRNHLASITNLSMVGRNGMHKYNNQDHSMLTAMMAVWNLQGASHDLWEVNTDYEYHEEIHAS